MYDKGTQVGCMGNSKTVKGEKRLGEENRSARDTGEVNGKIEGQERKENIWMKEKLHL